MLRLKYAHYILLAVSELLQALGAPHRHRKSNLYGITENIELPSALPPAMQGQYQYDSCYFSNLLPAAAPSFSHLPLQLRMYLTGSLLLHIDAHLPTSGKFDRTFPDCAALDFLSLAKTLSLKPTLTFCHFKGVFGPFYAVLALACALQSPSNLPHPTSRPY